VFDASACISTSSTKVIEIWYWHCQHRALRSACVALQDMVLQVGSLLRLV
jgi:hypothetical protein